MAWGVRWYLVGSIILGLLGVLAGCSGGGFWLGEADSLSDCGANLISLFRFASSWRKIFKCVVALP